MQMRTTIARPVSAEGVGLHSGEMVQMTLRPGRSGSGIVFARTDMGGAEVAADWRNLARTSYATTLENDGVTVGTVEHLLSAAAGMGIDDLHVDLSGGEVPILDGSAAPFVQLLVQAGRQDGHMVRQVMRIEEPISIHDGEKSLTINPGRGLKVRYAISFDHPIIRDSERLFTLRARSYARDIAPARTFCRLEEVEALREAGLAQGGNLENALVVDQDGLLNGPLRYRDEFVRHKILDLLGDLALLGVPVEGMITAERAGHSMHTRLVAELVARPEAWSLVPADAVSQPAAEALPVPA